MASARKFQIGDLVGEYRDLGSSVMTIDSSGDVILLASKRVLQFINLSSPKHPHRIPRKNVKWEVNAAQWNPHKSNGTVFVVTRNNQADICSFQDGKYEVKSTLQSHTRSITDLDWSHSSSNLLLTCSSDSNALLWDVRTCFLSASKPVQTFETMQSCSTSQVKWNKLEENIFATSQDRDIRIWDTRKTDRPVYISGHLKKIHGLDWSPHNSKLLASASEDGSVKFWDYTQGPQSNNIGGLMSNNSRSPVWKARFAPFENSLLTIDVSPLRREGDNSLMLWDIADLTSPDLKFTFVGHSDVVTEFQWRKPTTENQFQLVTWSRDQTLRMCKYEPTDGGHKVIDINMERQSNGTENGSPPVYDHTPPNGVNGDHQNGVEPTVTVLPRPGVSSSATADEEGTDDDDDDDSSQDDIIPPSTRSPAKNTRNHLRPNQPNSNSASPTLPTRQPHLSSHKEDLDLSKPVILQQENTTSGDNFYCDDDDDDDDEAIPTSPNPYGSTLQNEFRFLSTISGVSVRFELSQRKSFVAINNIGEHKINLIISFPDMYPEETPVFRFDPSTTIEEALQLKLIIEMNDAASPLISRSKACVEKCIHKLKSTVEEMYANNSLESDPRHQSGQASLLSQQLYNNNIPYPRTCGARFCNDKLVTFQRPVHPAQSTPRSLSDANSTHTPHVSRTRSTFFTPLSRSPKDSHSFFTKRGHRQRQLKKEKSGPITVYDISSLLPVNKSMALECRLDATAAACRHNAEIAVAHGRRDLHQIWKLIEEFMDDRLTAPSDPNDLKSGVPWAFLPMGRPMVESIIRHYSTIGDFQTLSLLACMFPYEVPSSIPSVEIERPLQQFNLQRSSSNMKLLGTSPASSLTGRSPPEKGYLSIEPNNTDGLTYGWSTSSRRRADSHNGSLQDITRNSYPYPGDPDNDVQKHKSDAQILDPTKGLLYDFYKSQYGDILYRWGFLEERLELLKTSASQPNQELSALSLTCGTCFEAYQDSWCANCKRQKLKCALCRSGVKGPAALCMTCGHGGHTQHMKLWFETETECASGCGCECLTTNTEER